MSKGRSTAFAGIPDGFRGEAFSVEVEWGRALDGMHLGCGFDGQGMTGKVMGGSGNPSLESETPLQAACRRDQEGERWPLGGGSRSLEGETRTLGGERSTLDCERCTLDGERSTLDDERSTLDGGSGTLGGGRRGLGGESRNSFAFREGLGCQNAEMIIRHFSGICDRGSESG